MDGEQLTYHELDFKDNDKVNKIILDITREVLVKDNDIKFRATRGAAGLEAPPSRVRAKAKASRTCSVL
jgi:hypothetical protein